MHTAVMQELGNFVTIGGILVTFVAYFGQQSGTTFAELEPGLVRRWRTVGAWVRRKLGRSQSAVVQVGTAVAFASGGGVVAWSWNPINSDDDINVRVEALAQNLEQLRTNMSELREMDIKHFRNVTEALGTKLVDLRRLVNERHAKTRQQTTSAMRWELRGLLITLIGAGISVLG